MYVRLTGHFEIVRADSRKISFTTWNSVEIELDMFKINSSCVIRIPASARLQAKGTKGGESVQSAKQFNRGDKITVKLGYNNQLETEFTGYISRVNFTSPCEIECEGFEFLLRSPCETKTWKQTNMKEVIQYIIKDTPIELSDEIPDVNFTKFVIPANMTKLEALQMVKDKYGMTIFFDGSLLYAGLAYVPDKGTVKYKLGWNTIKDNDLKYRNAEDVSLKIKAVWIKPDNTKLEAEVGDPKGSLRTLFFYNVSSKSELEKLAKEEIQKYKYSGYEGKITTFLQPFVKPGMKGELQDPRYEERHGTYYITKVKTKADRNGGRRTVDFTLKL